MRSFIVLILLVGAGVLPATANLVYDPPTGIPVVDPYNARVQPIISTDPEGNALHIWRAQPGGHSAIFGQLVSADGELLWENGGRVLADAAWHQELPQLVRVDDGWILTWLDLRHATNREQTPRIYAQKITFDGQLLWEGDTLLGGVLLDLPEPYIASRRRMQMIADGSGGAYIAWTEAEVDIDLGPVTLRIAHLLGTGVLDPAWDDALVLAHPDSQPRCTSLYFSLMPDGENGCYVQWRNEPAGIDLNEVALQRVAADGALPWGNPLAIPSPLGNPDDNFQDPRDWMSVSDGDSGLFLVTWGETAPDNFALAFYRIGSDGSLVYGNEPVLLENGLYRPGSLHAVPSISGSAIVAWSNRIGYTGGPLRLMRVGGADAGSAFLWQEPVEQEGVYIANDGMKASADGSAWLLDEPVAQVTPDGTFSFHGDAWSELSGALGEIRPVPGGEQLIVQVPDYTAPFRLLTRRFDLASQSWMLDEDFAIIDTVDYFTPTAQLAVSGDLLGVLDHRGDYYGGVPHLQRVDLLTGAPVDSGGAQPLLPGIADSNLPALAGKLVGTENGSFVYAGLQDVSWSGTLYLQRIDPDGQLLHGPTGVSVATSELTYNPAVELISLPDDEALAAFRTDDGDIGMQRFDSEGQPLWGDGESCIYLENPWGSGGIRSILYAPAVDAIALLLYVGHLELHLLDRQTGAPLWENPVYLAGTQGDLALMPVDDGFVMVTAENNRLRGQRINYDGDRLWGTLPVDLLGEPIAGSTLELGQSSDTTSFFHASWVQEGVRFIRRLDMDGTLLPGTAQITDELLVDDFHMIVLPDENYYVITSEYRSPAGPASGHMDLLYTHLGHDGHPLPGYDNGNRDLIARPGSQYFRSMIPDGVGGVVFLYQDESSQTLDWNEHGTFRFQRIHDGLSGVGDGPTGDDPGHPGGWALSNAWPNPFNATTAVTVALPAAGDLRVALYDVLGREVIVLHEGMQPAGTYRVRLDAADLASGLYFVRASLPGHAPLTRKIVLLK